jgi:hypothetical protein
MAETVSRLTLIVLRLILSVLYNEMESPKTVQLLSVGS